MKVALTTAVEEYNKVFGEKEYSIYRKPDGVLFAIKQQGFSWSAMFFSGLWCLLKGLYNELFILIGYQIVISIFAIQTEYELIGNFVRLLFHILFSIHLGLHGNKLYIKKCTSKYQLIKTVKAFSREDALLKVAPGLVIKDTLKISFGILLVIIGLLGGLIPIFQGWMFGIPGLIILAKYFPPAKHLLVWARNKAGLNNHDK